MDQNGSGDAAWRGSMRTVIRKGLSALPPDAALFPYRQMMGTFKRLGGYPSQRQLETLSDTGRMNLDLRDGLQRNMFYCGFYEPRYTACLLRFLEPGTTLVDVGSNVGYYTVLAGLRSGPKGHVYAFEPNPNAFGDLQQNVKR